MASKMSVVSTKSTSTTTTSTTLSFKPSSSQSMEVSPVQAIVNSSGTARCSECGKYKKASL